MELFGGDMKLKFRISLRLVWYAVLIWLATFVISATMVLPWSYMACAFVVLVASVFYVRSEVSKYKRARIARDAIFEIGLFTAIGWFAAIALISTAEIVGFYYFNVALFFSDLRNWFLFPLILTVPVLYSLVLEGRKSKKRKLHRGNFFSLNNLFFKPI